MTKDQRISVSMLEDYGFCPYKFKLSVADHIEGINTEEKIEGRNIHNEAYYKFSKTAERRARDQTLQRIKSVKETGESFEIPEFKLWSNMHSLEGQMDMLRIEPDIATIIERKPGRTAFGSYKLQVVAYCFLFRRYTEWTDNICAVIQNRDIKYELWRDGYSEKYETEVLRVLDKIKRLLNNEIHWSPEEFRDDDLEWISYKWPIRNKCKACSCRDTCDKRCT